MNHSCSQSRYPKSMHGSTNYPAVGRKSASFFIVLLASAVQEHSHWRGAEPKRRQWRMKRGESLVSKEVCRTAEKADDYYEPDRANAVKRDGVRLPYAPLKTLRINILKVFTLQNRSCKCMQILQAYIRTLNKLGSYEFALS